MALIKVNCFYFVKLNLKPNICFLRRFHEREISRSVVVFSLREKNAKEKKQQALV